MDTLIDQDDIIAASYWICNNWNSSEATPFLTFVHSDIFRRDWYNIHPNNQSLPYLFNCIPTFEIDPSLNIAVADKKASHKSTSLQ